MDHPEMDRFSFGRNWQNFIGKLDEARIERAVRSLSDFLGVERIDGQFLDIGCGSGLFSLAAVRLGAAFVLSMDYDPESVAASREVRRRFAPDAAHWDIRQGSVLDGAAMEALGLFDIVYSWGVLHHTGNMREAIAQVCGRVRPGGLLYIAIYNTYSRSRWIGRVKRFYCRRGALVRRVMEVGYAARGIAAYLARLRNPIREIREYGRNSRGMSWWNDRVDWIGGYPYEHALPEEILALVGSLGFELQNLKTCNGGKGCNEYLFRRK